MRLDGYSDERVEYPVYIPLEKWPNMATVTCYNQAVTFSFRIWFIVQTYRMIDHKPLLGLKIFSVFWDLYCAAPERRETCDHSSEAKAFHDYVSGFKSMHVHTIDFTCM